MKPLFKKSFKNSEKWAAKFLRIVWIIGRDAFLFILIFVLLEVAFGEFLFYKYIFLAEQQEPEDGAIPMEFQKKMYEAVLAELESRERISESLVKEAYEEPFW